MDATNPMTPENQQKRADSRRKRKAILAGGVVLGLGAAVTLAAWSDDVFANGTFNTSDKFALEASTDGTDFERHATEGTAASLVFNATGITPGDVRYAPLTIRTTDGSSAGTISNLDVSVVDNGLAPALDYTIYSGGTTCDANGTDGSAWATDQAVTTAEPTHGTALSVGASEADPVSLCIAVTLPRAKQDNVSLTAGVAGATVTWNFYGEPTP